MVELQVGLLLSNQNIMTGNFAHNFSNSQKISLKFFRALLSEVK